MMTKLSFAYDGFLVYTIVFIKKKLYLIYVSYL